MKRVNGYLLCDKCKKLLKDRMDMIAFNGKKGVMVCCKKCYEKVTGEKA